MSDIINAVQEMARGLHDAGGMDKTTLRQLEALCLPKARALCPEQIKAIREKIRMSRILFTT